MSDNTSNMEKSTKTGTEIIQEIDENHSQIISLQRTQKLLIKELEKIHKIEVKEASKRKKNSNSGEKRDPSGFVAKQCVPIEFCEQPWGCEKDQQIERTNLTKMVYDYVKENSLQDPSDKRRIFADDVIKTLFHMEDGDELHFNNFQTYMKRLYNRDFENKTQKTNDDSDVVASDQDSENDSADEEIDEPVVIKKTEKSSKKKGKKANTASKAL